jgi:hypothetical protein
MKEKSPYLPEEDGAPEDLPTPWGFRVLVGVAALYLGWRLVQGIIWVAGWLGSG